MFVGAHYKHIFAPSKNSNPMAVSSLSTASHGGLIRKSLQMSNGQPHPESPKKLVSGVSWYCDIASFHHVRFFNRQQ